MENAFSPAASDTARNAARDAKKLGQDVKSDFNDAVSRGRDIASQVASGARDAADDLSGRAREYVAEGRNRLSKTAGRVSEYADDNTALVAVAAFGAGLVLGHIATRRS